MPLIKATTFFLQHPKGSTHTYTSLEPIQKCGIKYKGPEGK
jgi:hypothetical protein